MSGDISFGGLSSGLDTKSIVNSLVSLKQTQLIKPITDRIATLQGQQTALTPIISQMKALSDAARLLKDTTTNTFNAKSGTSSNTDKVVVTAVDASKAIAGTFNVTDITALAQADRVIFNGVANKDVTTFGTGTIAITYKGATKNIVIGNTNNTLNGIVTAINNASAGVTASIINDGSATPYRLVLTSKDTGSDTRITHTIDSVLTLVVDAAASAAAANEPQSAAFKVNAVSMASKTNQVTDAINGVTFNLLATDTTGATVTVKNSSAAVLANISSFVTAYATLRATLRSTVLPDPKTGKLGVLGGDITLTSANVNLDRSMGKVMKSLSGYAYTTLAQIGITKDSAGTMQVDTGKLTSALESNLTSVRLLFQGTTGEDGIALEVFKTVDVLTRPNGVFDKRDKSTTNNLNDLDKQGRVQADHVVNYRKQLQDQFNALEKTLNTLKAAGAQLDAYTGIYSSSSNKLL